MKSKLSLILFVICYFMTGNWTITDILITPIFKNIFIGLFFGIILILRLSYKTKIINKPLFFLAIIGIISVSVNGFSAFSLIFQFIFLLLFSFSYFDINEFKYVLKLINRICFFLVLISVTQMILIMLNPEFLKYAYPITATDLDLDSTAKIEHWIQYMGGLTFERYDLFGFIVPRFSSFLTEPSAVPVLIILPKILSSYLNKFTLLDFLYIFFLVIFFRSGFVTIFSALFFIFYLYSKINFPFFRISIIGFIITFAILSQNRDDLSLDFINYSNENEIFSFEDKQNSINTRIDGAEEMLRNFKFFGNHSTEIYGVGLIIYYATMYGILGIIYLIFFSYKIYKYDHKLVILIFIFNLTLLSKGFSTIFPFILLTYFCLNASASYKYTQKV